MKQIAYDASQVRPMGDGLFGDITDTFCNPSFVIAGLDPAIHDEAPRIPP